MDYISAGVDVAAGRAFVERIRNSVEATNRPEVVGALGGFGGLFRLPEGLSQPLLVAGCDGVGTKLDLAQKYGQHQGVGIDLVAMCVNDIITSGAEPLFFLDYIATGKLSSEVLASVVEGIATGCQRCRCALLGGETAEMPGFYEVGQYDLAGFCVGVVDQSKLIDGRNVNPGDSIVAVASNGVHSNGFSLVRSILNRKSQAALEQLGGSNQTVIDALLMPTLLYADLVKALRHQAVIIHAMAHITGGGLIENLPRCLPKGLRAAINANSWQRPELFCWIQEQGQVPEADLWNTFNLGIGFCLVIPSGDLQKTLKLCAECGYSAWRLGQVVEGDSNEPPLDGLPY